MFVVVDTLLSFFHPDYSSVDDPISCLLLGRFCKELFLQGTGNNRCRKL